VLQLVAEKSSEMGLDQENNAWVDAPAERTRSSFFETCSNPGCRSGWLHLLRSRTTPVFEGGWNCSLDCTAARIRGAIRREMDARGISQEPHRHRIPLGLMMLEQGWISQNQLRQAVGAQRTAQAGRLGHWLVKQAGVSEHQVTRALGLQWSCPVLSLDFHDPEAMTSALPRLFVDAYGALPLRVAAGKLMYMGFEDRLDPALALAIERMTGLRVENGLVNGTLFRDAHLRMLKAKYPSVELIEAASEPALAHALARVIERVRPVESRLVRVHDCIWLRLWKRPQRTPLPETDSVHDVVCSIGSH